MVTKNTIRFLDMICIIYGIMWRLGYPSGG
jgi:hypothetical protein